MKILLVEPPKAPLSIGGEDIFLFEPLALEYVGAGVVDDHDVRLLDMRLDHDLAGTLNSFTPDVVGFTAYTVHVDVVRALAADVKAWNPEVVTVVGGHHATVVPDDFAWPGVDLVVVGEGVAAFTEVVRRLEAGDGCHGISGVGVVESSHVEMAEPAVFVEPDALPLPARELSADYRAHYFSEWMQPLASMRTSRGCPFRCSFCAQWKLAGGRYSGRDPDGVVEELSTIDEDYVFFADDESLVDVDRMAVLAQRIEASGIAKRYFLYGRADTIAMNPGLLEAWRRVGLERVFVGLEFFRDSDLDLINKSCTTGDNAAAVRILHDLDIDIYASFIIRPEFEHSDFDALRAYCRELDIGFAGFAVLTPLPGTDLMDEVQDRLLTTDPAFFDFIHTVLPTTLPLREFYQEYARLITSATSTANRIALLRKFPLAKLPWVFAITFRLLRRLRAVHRDYDGLRAAAG